MKKIRYWIILLSVACVMSSCIEDPVIPQDGNIQLKTISVTDIESNSVVVTGKFIFANGSAAPTIQERGFCYATHENPTKKDKFKISALKTDSISERISGLTPKTTYYIRIYAHDGISGNFVYGNEVSFTTDEGGSIIVTTGDADNITHTSVTINGLVKSEGKISIKERGVYLGTTPNPNVNKQVAENDSISVTFTDLSPNTTYYYYAYAVDNNGEYTCGTVKSFSSRSTEEIITIAEFKQLSPSDTYYKLNGVVGYIADSEKGCIYIVDETGMLPVRNLGSLATLGISQGDNIIIKAKRSIYSASIIADYSLFETDIIPSTILPFTFSLEPQQATNPFNIQYSNIKVTPIITNRTNKYSIDLWDEHHLLNLIFKCDYDSTTIIPVGTYYISDKDTIGRSIIASSGFDLNNGTISCVYYDLNARTDFPKMNVYCLTEGRVDVSFSDSIVTLRVRAITKNKSNVNTTWRGPLKDYYSISDTD